MRTKDRLTEKQGKYFRFIKPIDYYKCCEGRTTIPVGAVCKFEKTYYHEDFCDNRIFFIHTKNYLPWTAMFFLNEDPDFYLQELTGEELEKAKQEEKKEISA